MKLANHLTIRLSGLFIIILLIWSVIYIFVQMAEIYDGIDEGLSNLKQEFIIKANASDDFIDAMTLHDPINVIVDKITHDEAIQLKETYSTAKVYFPTEDEDEEVRMLTTAFLCKRDQQYYSLKLFTSTVESEDLIKNMFYLLGSLWVILGITIVVALKKIINKSNRPFYMVLDNLKRFKLNSSKMIDFPQTSINEYKELNSSIQDLLEKNINTFTEQKNFIENASHELQTPLTIAISKLDLMMNNSELGKNQLEEIDAVLRDLNRMKRLNSTLLLLSKIKNRQFTDNIEVNLSLIFENTIEDFRDLAEYKGITINITIDGNATTIMNKDLAHILATNLIKNAVTHNIANGYIDIYISEKLITIMNSGSVIDKDVNIFERYSSQSEDSQSSGLGLSIVKSIADLYKFRLSHQYKGKHIIRLYLPK